MKKTGREKSRDTVPLKQNTSSSSMMLENAHDEFILQKLLAADNFVFMYLIVLQMV